MAKKRKKKTSSREKTTRKTKKKTTKKRSRKTTSKVEDALVENLIGLQKVNTKMAEKFDHLSNEISKLLALFEVAAKDFAKNPEIRPLEKDSQFLDKVDTLLEQNKTIAKGLTLMEERIKERMHLKEEEEEEIDEPISLPKIHIAPKMPTAIEQPKEVKLPTPKLEPIQKTSILTRTITPPQMPSAPRQMTQTNENTTAPVRMSQQPTAMTTTEATSPSQSQPLTPGLPDLPKQTYPEDSVNTPEPKNEQNLPALPKHGDQPEDDNTMMPSQFSRKPVPKY